MLIHLLECRAILRQRIQAVNVNARPQGYIGVCIYVVEAPTTAADVELRDVVHGMSYDVLGTLIEVISGLRYDKYITKHILSPLEMNNRFFIIPASVRTRLVEVYEPTSNSQNLKLTSYHDTNYPIIEDNQFFREERFYRTQKKTCH